MISAFLFKFTLPQECETAVVCIELGDPIPYLYILATDIDIGSDYLTNLVSTYVVCERLSVMHKQVSGWTVNFCPNSPESPFLEFQTRKPPPQWKTSDLRWPKFTPEYPPSPNEKNEKLQIWDDQSLLQNIPPPNEKLQIWDDQSLLWNTPPLGLESGRSYVETNLYPPWIPLVRLLKQSLTNCYSLLCKNTFLNVYSRLMKISPSPIYSDRYYFVLLFVFCIGQNIGDRLNFITF